MFYVTQIYRFDSNVFIHYRRLKLDNFDYNAACTKIAEMTEGLSGREISKLGVAWQASAYASADGVLTEKMLYDRVADVLHHHVQKIEWETAEESRKRNPSIVNPIISS